MLNERLKNYKPYDYSGACSFYLVSVVVVLLCQALAGVVAAALSPTYPDIANSGVFNTAFMIVFQVANALFIVVYSYVKKSKFSFTYFSDETTGKGLNAWHIIVPIVAACALMTAMYLPTIWYGYLTQAMGIPEDFGAVDLSSAASVVMIVIASVFFAPIFEETIYRGTLLHGLRENHSGEKAILMSAFSFMLMHMSPLQVVFQFALGAVSALLAIFSRRLLPSIILHATSNALALVMQLTPLAASLGNCVTWLTNNPAAAVTVTVAMFVAGGGVLGGLLVLTIRTTRKGNEKAKRPEQEGEDDGENAIYREAVALVKRKDGLIKYWIAAGICIIMFVVNLVTAIVS